MYSYVLKRKLCTHLGFTAKIFTTADLFLRYGIRIVSVCFLNAVKSTSAYLHTFIGCDKTPVFAQALKIHKLNERNDVQCCVPLLVVPLHTCIIHRQRHRRASPHVHSGVLHMEPVVYKEVR